MKSYLAGTAVQLGVVFADADGNALSPVSATYRVANSQGDVLLDETDFDINQTYVVIDAQINEVQAIDFNAISRDEADKYAIAEARIVEFKLTLDDGNIYPMDFAYIVAPREQLVAGFNSFQTLRQAFLSALSVPGTTNWDNAVESDRIAAMVEAYRRICTFRFTDITQGQAYLNESRIIGDISRVPPREFPNLSDRLRKALRLAQVAEAETILGGGDQANELRKAGLISQTIGETQEMWRNSKPLDMQLSKEALRYIAQYISINKRIGRS